MSLVLVNQNRRNRKEATKHQHRSKSAWKRPSKKSRMKMKKLERTKVSL